MKLKKTTNFAEQLQKYIDTTPKDILDEEFSRYRKEYNYGPSAEEYMYETEKYINKNKMYNKIIDYIKCHTWCIFIIMITTIPCSLFLIFLFISIVPSVVSITLFLLTMIILPIYFISRRIAHNNKENKL